jgi:mRNA-degrading endonuclease RelE of RelBE toxin-antitoxin system
MREMAVLIPSKAAKQIRKSGMPDEDWQDLRRRLERIARDPYASHPDVERLTDGSFRVRHGMWRAIYVVTEDGDVEVVGAGHRREVYRR